MVRVFISFFILDSYNPFFTNDETKNFAILSILLPIFLSFFLEYLFIIYKFIKNFLFNIFYTFYIFIY